MSKTTAPREDRRRIDDRMVRQRNRNRPLSRTDRQTVNGRAKQGDSLCHRLPPGLIGLLIAELFVIVTLVAWSRA